MTTSQIIKKLKEIDDNLATALSTVVYEADEMLMSHNDCDISEDDDFAIAIREAFEPNTVNIDLVDINNDKSVCTISIKFNK